MPHVIEIAKSGRASCRTCRQAIPKGDLRFGEESVNAFADAGTMTYLWHHMKCAAKKKPGQLREALAGYIGDVPGREEIDRLVAENEPKQKPTKFPYAERAPSGRARCAVCGELIDKDALRVATQRENEAGSSMMAPAARYLHPQCSGQDESVTLDAIRANSKGLTPADLAEVESALSESESPET